MFALCPHCQFLVTVDPRSGRLPSNCPSCGGVLEDAGETAAAQDPPARPTTDTAPDPTRTVPGAVPAAADFDADAGTGDDAAPDAANDASSPSAETVPGTVPADPDPDPDADPQTVAGEPAQSNEDRSAATPAPAPAQKSGPDTAPAVPGPDGPEAVAEDAPKSDDAVGDPSRAPESAPDTVPEGADDLGADAGEPAAVQPEGPTSLAAPAVPKTGKPRATRALPRFLDQRVGAPREGRRAQLLTWGAVALLALVLGLQLVLADRARLSQDAQWRPFVSTLCGALGCSVPPWHEPDAFVMLSRDVHAHPRRPGTLRVSASFRNDARWAQPWPSLLLTLSDLDGRTAGARVFAPEDYVGEDAPALLAPGQSANVTLDVLEPAPRIVAFTFDFR